MEQTGEFSVVLPYNEKKIKDKYLITTFFGSWALLEESAYMQLKKNKIDGQLFDFLHQNQIIVTEDNVHELTKNYRNLNANLFTGPSLHIVSLTENCNLGCVYCHAPINNASGEKMDSETAIRILDFIFQTSAKAITLEFQGGETLLNYDAVKYMVQEARRLNELEKKDLEITIVSNLTLPTQEQIEFLVNNNVTVAVSFDGPEYVHNANRPYLDGRGTYEKVVENIRRFDAVSLPKGKRIISALPTITRHSLKYGKEIVDEYVKHKFKKIHMRFLNHLGEAKKNWNTISYEPEQFVKFWRDTTDYLLELNRQGVPIREGMANIMLTKILGKRDPMYTELMSPCGAGRTQILYAENGDVFTCDEGRMIHSDLFKIGNVKKNSYKEVLGNPGMFYITASSMMNLYTPRSAYLPWNGTCPVITYSMQGNVVPKTACSFKNIIYTAQFDYLFERMVDDPKNIEIFKSWISS